MMPMEAMPYLNSVRFLAKKPVLPGKPLTFLRLFKRQIEETQKEQVPKQGTQGADNIFLVKYIGLHTETYFVHIMENTLHTAS